MTLEPYFASLSTRARHALLNMGINKNSTADHICLAGRSGFIFQGNVGKKTIAEIDEIIAANGLRYWDDGLDVRPNIDKDAFSLGEFSDSIGTRSSASDKFQVRHGPAWRAEMINRLPKRHQWGIGVSNIAEHWMRWMGLSYSAPPEYIKLAIDPAFDFICHPEIISILNNFLDCEYSLVTAVVGQKRHPSPLYRGRSILVRCALAFSLVIGRQIDSSSVKSLERYIRDTIERDGSWSVIEISLIWDRHLLTNRDDSRALLDAPSYFNRYLSEQNARISAYENDLLLI